MFVVFICILILDIPTKAGPSLDFPDSHLDRGKSKCSPGGKFPLRGLQIARPSRAIFVHFARALAARLLRVIVGDERRRHLPEFRNSGLSGDVAGLRGAARNNQTIMNSITRILLAGAACALGCAFASTSFAEVATPGDAQVQGPAPSPSYVWMSGHWDSDGGQWKWVAAHWELPPAQSATWVAGHWVSQAGKWVWANGAWNVGESQQAQAGPPQPPVQAAPDGALSSPAPYTPAPSPYVEGEDGPGGVSRVDTEGTVVTDYGPAVYSAYPDYGYAYGYGGYPWLWDGAIIGFGFGPRFYGGHYGYGGRGGRYGGSYGGGHAAHGSTAVHFAGHTH
jgi:hypothetical protein